MNEVNEASPASETSDVERVVMRHSSYVAVVGDGVDVRIQVEDADDIEIVNMAMQIAERRKKRKEKKRKEKQ